MEKPELKPYDLVNLSKKFEIYLDNTLENDFKIPVCFEKEELKARIECLISELNYNLCYTENKEFTIEKIKEAFKEILEE